MLITPHLITGAAIATKVGSYSPLMVVLVLASHFILDAIPHCDEVDENRLSKKQILACLLDLIIGSILFWVMFSKLNLILALVGAVIGILPDVVDNLHLAFPAIANQKWRRVYHSWHVKIQQIKPGWIIGLTIQILVVIGIWFWVGIK